MNARICAVCSQSACRFMCAKCARAVLCSAHCVAIHVQDCSSRRELASVAGPAEDLQSRALQTTVDFGGWRRKTASPDVAATPRILAPAVPAADAAGTPHIASAATPKRPHRGLVLTPAGSDRSQRLRRYVHTMHAEAVEQVAAYGRVMYLADEFLQPFDISKPYARNETLAASNSRVMYSRILAELDVQLHLAQSLVDVDQPRRSYLDWLQAAHDMSTYASIEGDTILRHIIRNTPSNTLFLLSCAMSLCMVAEKTCCLAFYSCTSRDLVAVAAVHQLQAELALYLDPSAPLLALLHSKDLRMVGVPDVLEFARALVALQNYLRVPPSSSDGSTGGAVAAIKRAIGPTEISKKLSSEEHAVRLKDLSALLATCIRKLREILSPAYSEVGGVEDPADVNTIRIARSEEGSGSGAFVPKPPLVPHTYFSSTFLPSAPAGMNSGETRSI